jgi:hypothetical protein
MLFIKLTFLFQYYRVFRHVQRMKIMYIVAMVVIGGWCLGQVLAVTFTCIPVSGVWDKTIDAKCQSQEVGVYLNAAGTLVTDIMILVLPLPSVWQLKLPRPQKLGLLCIFAIGGFTSAISLFRLTTLTGGADFTYGVATSSCWSVAELSSGIIAAALATIRPLLSRYIPAFASSRSKSPSAYQGYPPTIGSSQKRSWHLQHDASTSRNTSADSDADLFYHQGYEVQHGRTSRSGRQSVVRPSSQLTRNSEISDSFNVAFEELGLSKPERSHSRKALEPRLEEWSGGESKENLGLTPGVKTMVTGGTPNQPRTSGELDDAGRPRGLAIRVEKDWIVEESTLRQPPRQ